jgi:glutaredoxin
MSTYRVIGAEWCPYCMKVKNYMEKNSIKFEWVDSDTAEGGKVREEERKRYNYNTIPMVFENGKFIGGCDAYFAKM